MKYGFIKVASAVPMVKVGDVKYNVEQIENLTVQGRDAERVWRKELLCALRAQRGRHESDNRISLTAALIFRAAVFAYCGKYVLRNCKYWETVDFALRIMPICGIVYSVSL